AVGIGPEVAVERPEGVVVLPGQRVGPAESPEVLAVVPYGAGVDGRLQVAHRAVIVDDVGGEVFRTRHLRLGRLFGGGEVALDLLQPGQKLLGAIGAPGGAGAKGDEGRVGQLDVGRLAEQ